MKILLRELVDKIGRENIFLISGNYGLDNPISNVTVLDAPDGPKWLKGNEFILTSAYLFQEDKNSLIDFVTELINIKASGLGIKMHRYIDNIPEALIELSEKNNFPIILLPSRYVWSDVISVFFELKYEVGNNKSKKSEISKLNEVMKSIELSYRQYMECIAKNYDVSVVYTDNSFVALSLMESITIKSIFVQKILNELNKSVLDQDTVLYIEFDTIRLVDNFFMLISSKPNQLTNMNHYFVYIADSKDKLELIQDFLDIIDFKIDSIKNSQIYVQDESIRNFIAKLIADQISEVDFNFFKNRNQGNNIVVFYCCLIISGSNRTENLFNLKLNRKYIESKHVPKIHFHSVDNINEEEIIVILEIESCHNYDINIVLMRKYINQCNEYKELDGNNIIAVGNIYNSYRKVNESYKEAMKAKKISEKLFKNTKICFYSDVFMFANIKEFQGIRDSLTDIDFILDLQKELHFDILNTLKTFLRTGSYKIAAIELFVHENTLRYRIKKINDILEVDLNKVELQHLFFNRISLWELINDEILKSY